MSIQISAEMEARLHNEARKSGGFSLYAYVIMPDHVHVITNSILPPSKTAIHKRNYRTQSDWLFERERPRKLVGKAAA